MNELRIRIDHFLHGVYSATADAKLDDITNLLKQVLAQGVAMSAELDTLTSTVTEATTVEQSAIVLLNGLSAQMAALKNDPAAIQALSDSLHSKSSELAQAIQANTPAA